MPVFAHPAALSAYRKLRCYKNKLLNLLDAPVVVLIYHRVTVLPNDPHLLAVSPDNFRAHMQYLQDHFAVARFEDDWSALREPAVVVTFDDGYADNAREALPILEDVGLPATFFISTGTLGTCYEFWWDELERVLLGEYRYPSEFRLNDPQYGKTWATATPAQRKELHDELHGLFFRSIKAKRREDWLEQLRCWAGLDSTGKEENRAMSLNEVKTLANCRWSTIGGHTITHTPLSALSEEEQRLEIVRSRQQLEELAGKPIEVFSYPFGTKSHYNKVSVDLCREAGFRKVASNFPGQAHRWTDPCQIPRQLVRNWDVETFKVKFKGFWT